jgi:hypothetical protein
VIRDVLGGLGPGLSADIALFINPGMFGRVLRTEGSYRSKAL